jgi:hypothetical protein
VATGSFERQTPPFWKCWYSTNIDCQPLYKETMVSHRSDCKNLWKKAWTESCNDHRCRVNHVSTSRVFFGYCMQFYRPLPVWSVPSEQLPFLPHGLTILLPQTNSKTQRKCSLLSDSEATMKILPKKHDFKIVKDQPLIGSI